MPETLVPKLLTTLGDVEVYQVPEITIPTSLRWMLPGASPEVIEQAKATLDPVFFGEKGRLIQSVHTYVLKSPERIALIDTGVGNGKSRAGGIPAFDMLDTPFLLRLASIGVTPDDVDLVLCTHMHVDHLGWDTQRSGEEWVPTFPKARYLFVDKEFTAFIDGTENDEGASLIREDTIDPLVGAGLIDLVAADHRIGGDIRFVPSHGHSPAHVNIALEGGGRSAEFIGDAMHNPIQVLLPSVASALNGPEQATTTRIDMVNRLADTDTMVFGAHFSEPCGGYIRTVADGHTFVPLSEE